MFRGLLDKKDLVGSLLQLNKHQIHLRYDEVV